MMKSNIQVSNHPDPYFYIKSTLNRIKKHRYFYIKSKFSTSMSSPSQCSKAGPMESIGSRPAHMAPLRMRSPVFFFFRRPYYRLIYIVHMYIYIYTYIHTYVYIYVYTYIYIYIHKRHI